MATTTVPERSRPLRTTEISRLTATDAPGPRLVLVPSDTGRGGPLAINRRDAIYRRTLALADVVAVTVAPLLTMTLVGPNQPDVAMLVGAPLIVLMSKVIGIYDRDESLVRRSTLEETPALFQLATLYALIVWLINGLIITQTNVRREFLVDWIALFILLMLCRVAARAVFRRTTTAERCLVIGDDAACEQILTKLGRGRALHARVVAYIPTGDVALDGVDMSALSHKCDLQTIVAQCAVDRIIVAPENADGEHVLDLIRVATSLGVKVSVVPRVLEVVGSSAEFDDVEGIPLLSLRRVRLNRSSQLVKRAMDVGVSAAAVTVLLPLAVAVSVAIKLDSRGPILFRQRRIGREGKPFEMLKFRTMVRDAEELRDELLHLNETQGLFKIADDPRITRVGRVLRRLSLDELPQLVNVIRGDMSIVGPRPLVAEEDRRIQGWHRRRLQLTPGMTGHWQILGSARIPLEEMVKIDYLYVTNWSIWNDIKILLRTVPYVFGGKGM